MNQVALCFAALEVIANEASTETGRRREMRSKILSPLGLGMNAEERAIRKGAADLLAAVRSRL